MGLGGMVSFGHAAYFGLGAYGVAGFQKFRLEHGGFITGGTGACGGGSIAVRLVLRGWRSVLSNAHPGFRADRMVGGVSMGCGPGGLADWCGPSAGLAATDGTGLWRGRHSGVAGTAAAFHFGLALRATRVRHELMRWVSTLSAFNWWAFVWPSPGRSGGRIIRVLQRRVSPETLMVAHQWCTRHGIDGGHAAGGGGVVYGHARLFVGITQHWGALFGAVILLIVMAFPSGAVCWWSARRQK